MPTAWAGLSQIEQLRQLYGQLYLISEVRGLWTAERRDGRGILRAWSPGGLLDLMKADYEREPVIPRQPRRRWFGGWS